MPPYLALSFHEGKNRISRLTTLRHEHSAFRLMFNNIRLNVRLGIQNHFTILCSFLFFFFFLLFLLSFCCAMVNANVRTLCKKDISHTCMDGEKELQTEIHFAFRMRLQGYLISLLSSVFHTHHTHLPEHIRFTLTILKIMFDLHLSKRSCICYLKPILTSFVQTRIEWQWQIEIESDISNIATTTPIDRIF